MSAHDLTSPWVGLRPYGNEDESRFFGRSIDTNSVADRWEANRLTLLVGESGVGKTSLLHAGVVPRLAGDGRRPPPVGDLAYRRTLPAPLIPARSPELFALLSSWQAAEDPARCVGLTVKEYFRRQTRVASPGRPILVAIDGAERVLRGDAPDERGNHRFIEELVDGLRAFSCVHLLLSIRPDCVEGARRVADLLGATPVRYDLLPLDRPSAIDAVRKPLRNNDVDFDPADPARLVDTLTIRLDGSQASPHEASVDPGLLQVLCAELWRRRRICGQSLSTLVDELVRDVDDVLAGFCTRTLFTLTTDHDLPTCEIGSWMRRTFTTRSRDARHARQSDRPDEITEAVARAVEDRHLIKFCRMDGVDCYQLQHPRLARALHRLGEAPVPERDATPAELLSDAEQAMSAGNLKLAKRYAQAVIGSAVSGHEQARIFARGLLGDIAHARAEHDDAIEAYKGAVASQVTADPKSRDIAYLYAAIARVFLLKGEPGEALDYARSGTIARADATIVKLETGRAYWFANRHRAAVKELDSILDREPDHVEARRIRGEMYTDMGKYGEALEDLGHGAVAAPPSARAARAMAAGLEDGLTPEEFDELRTEGGNHGLVLLNLARLMRRRSEKVTAMRLAAEALAATNPRLSKHHRAEAETISRGR